ncbi:Ser/Thr protein phosphatase [Tritrichomonas foetus]|uniref:Serine/threonine-protein phosphatase n=1 Tax=Tritrichomonas foetus TaxID=1144522 RepID=A0A1J4J8N7_9EUKA|nr:Ser/Thr protein phosphatase [Tritrichomonas foetus]|eukprot:OHS93765.1 Ser/Thr protein phosphatase [Tritrichomonas foetus]
MDKDLIANSNSKVTSFIFEQMFHLLTIEPDNLATVGRGTPLPSFEEFVLMKFLDSCIEAFSKSNKPFIELNTPLAVIGDLHGNFFDLLRIWKDIKDPFNLKILFLGDYVDRGEYQIETVTLLLLLARQYPNNIFLLRGNHEFRHVNGSHGFKEAVCARYSEELYEKYNQAFDYLPFAATIDNNYFCVHGGLSKRLMKLRSLSELNEIIKLPFKDDNDKFISDLVWSDPVDWAVEYISSQRGRGHRYGWNACQAFFNQFGKSMIIRAHESIDGGFKSNVNGLVLTVFSSSEYVNPTSQAGYLIIDEKGEFHRFFLPSKQFVSKTEASYENLVYEDDTTNIDLSKSMEINKAQFFEQITKGSPKKNLALTVSKTSNFRPFLASISLIRRPSKGKLTGRRIFHDPVKNSFKAIPSFVGDGL